MRWKLLSTHARLSNMNRRYRANVVFCLLIALATGASGIALAAEPDASPRFIDLSLLVSPDYPCTWPTFPPVQINPYQRIGPLSPYNSDLLVMDGNTGTQLDVPPHSITLPSSGLTNAGRFGSAFTDKIPAWQFVGEACVVDCGDLRDAAAPGRSAIVKRERLMSGKKSTDRSAPATWCCFTAALATSITGRCPKGVALPQIP